jgi:hypothetical protein
MEEKNQCQMTPEEIERHKEKIKMAMKISAEKLIQKKRLLGQQVVISENGIIKFINP